MIELIILFVCVRYIWAFMSMANSREYWQQRDLEKTWRNMSPEGRAQVAAHYNKMKSEGRI